MELILEERNKIAAIKRVSLVIIGRRWVSTTLISLVLSRVIQCKTSLILNFCESCVEEHKCKVYCKGPIETPLLVKKGEHINVNSGKEQNTNCKDILYHLFTHLRDVRPSKLNQSSSLLAPCYSYCVGPVNDPSMCSDGTRAISAVIWKEFRVDLDQAVNRLANGSQTTIGSFFDLMLPHALLSPFGTDTPSDFSMERLQVVHDTYHLSLDSN